MMNFLDLTMMLIPAIAILYHSVKLWAVVGGDNDIKEIKHVAYITMWMVAMTMNSASLGLLQ